jgi:hypothetical protein
MLTERREEHRSPTDEIIAISDGNETIFTRCCMTDVSDKGAQLRIPATYFLPNKFTLTRAGCVKRHCEVLWRKDDFLGIRFAAQ